MTATLRTGTLAGQPWWHLRGAREDAFALLGRTAGDSIRAVLAELPERGFLRSVAADRTGRARIDRIVERTREQTPSAYAELVALAEGAGVDPDDALLANLRGDLGGDDGTGCSDITWRRGRSLTGHNEDGAPGLDGRFGWLTLEIDGDPPVTTQWYPGFVPANAFAATAGGLVWGINHVQVDLPADAPGRYFVARCLQRHEDIDGAVGYLVSQACAGGLAYNLGEIRTGRIVSVEAAAGVCDVEESGDDAGVRWHTNHLRRARPPRREEASDGSATGGVRHLGERAESETRGRALERLTAWTGPPTADDILDVLAGAPVPDGVHRSASDGDPLMTLCTTVTDLDESVLTVRSRTGVQETIGFQVLIAGPGAP